MAWLPLVATYSLFFSADFPPALALLSAAANVLPPALLGILVLAVTRRISWDGARSRFFALHSLLAITYAVLSVVGSFLIFRALDGLRGGTWWRLPSDLDLRIFGWQLFVALLLYLALASVSYSLQFVVRLREEEARAFLEFVMHDKISFEYLAQSDHQVAVRITGVGKKATWTVRPIDWQPEAPGISIEAPPV